jgi:hypothetical protein
MRQLDGLALVLKQDSRLEAVLAVGDGQGPDALWHGEVRLVWNGWASLGQPAGGALASGPAVACNPDGRLVAFVIGSDLTVWFASQTQPGPDWTDWVSFGQPGGEPVISRPPTGGSAVDPTPALASNADGHLEVFVVSSDRTVWHSGQLPSGAWSAWAPLGLPGSGTVGPMTTAADADGSLELFTIDTAGAVWHCRQTQPNGSSWSGWESMDFPHSLSAFPAVLAAAQNHDGRLELFVVGSGGTLWHRWQTQPNGIWSDWKSLDTRGRGFAGIAVTAEPTGRLVLFAAERPTVEGHNSGGVLWQRGQITPGGSWSPWESWAGKLSLGQPGPLHLPGHIQAPVLALDGKGQLALYLRFSGSRHLYQYVLNGIDPAKQSAWDGGSDLPFTTV